LTASVVDETSLLEWSMSVEGSLGDMFYLYRAVGDGEREPLNNGDPIAFMPGTLEYSFVDPDIVEGEIYHYMLAYTGTEGYDEKHATVIYGAGEFRIYLPYIVR
jgi:hypothetical protein